VDDQPDGLGALSQLDGAVVAKQQIPGHIADGGPTGVVMPPDSEQQLVLGGGKPGRLGPGLGPVQEPEPRGGTGGTWAGESIAIRCYCALAS
jgi:hypothetical protein